MCENFFLLCMSFFIRISCLFTTGIQKCFIWIWAIYVHVNEAISQVMGQKLGQTNHTSAEKKENNDIKCFFFLLFLLLLVTISSEMSICVIPTTANKRVSSVSNCLVVNSVFAAPNWLLLISQLSTWIYIFIYTNNSVGRAELSRLFQFHFSWGGR